VLYKRAALMARPRSRAPPVGAGAVLTQAGDVEIEPENVWPRVTGLEALAESRLVLDAHGYTIGRKFDEFFGARGVACDAEEARAAFADDWLRIARLDPDAAPHSDLRPGCSSDDLALIALVYLYERCAEEWERVVDHCRIETLIASVDPAQLPFRDAGHVAPAVRRFRLMFETLLVAMRVERRMNAGCPTSFRRHAGEIVNMIKAGRPNLARVAPESRLHALYLWQERRIWAYDHFFSALALSGGLVESWTRDHASFQAYAGNFADEIASRKLKLEKLGPERVNQGFASELDAHLKLIRSMADFGPVAGLRLSEFKLVYCFPFAVAGAAPAELMEAQEKVEWGQVEDAESRRCFRPGRPDDVILGDILTLSASTAEAELPVGRRVAMQSFICNPVSAASDAPQAIRERIVPSAPQIELRPEIRLLRTGNHYLRIEVTENSYFRDRSAERFMSAHDLYRALRRASPACGEEPFLIENARMGASGLEPAWEETNLVRLSQACVDAYIAALKRALPGAALEPIVDFAKSHHLVVSARESGFGAHASEEAIARIEALFQSHVQGPAIMLEQWLARPSAADGAVVARVPVDDIEGGRMTASSNTTFISLPDAPNFIYMDYEDLAEFAATMDSVYLRWNRELDLATRANADRLDVFHVDEEGAHDQRIDSLARGMRDIDQSAVDLSRRIADAIHDREWLNSAEIVSNAVARRKLDTLVEATIAKRLERDMARKIEAAEKVQAALTNASRSRFRHVVDSKRRVDEDANGKLQALVLVLAILQSFQVILPPDRLVQHLSMGAFGVTTGSLWTTVVVGMVYVGFSVALTFVIMKLARRRKSARADKRG
jgi:hypothetical protein